MLLLPLVSSVLNFAFAKAPQLRETALGMILQFYLTLSVLVFIGVRD